MDKPIYDPHSEHNKLTLSPFGRLIGVNESDIEVKK